MLAVQPWLKPIARQAGMAAIAAAVAGSTDSDRRSFTGAESTAPARPARARMFTPLTCGPVSLNVVPSCPTAAPASAA